MRTSRNDLPAVPFRLVTTVCGAGVAGFGLLGLVSWYSGARVLSSVRPEYIPMAASTACSLILLGAVLLIATRKSLSAWGKAGAQALAILVAVFALLNLLGPFIGVNVGLEEKLFPTVERFGQVLTNRMSPLTALLFFLAGIDLLLILGRPNQAVTLFLEGFLGSLVTIGAFMCTAGYLFATPLLYGGAVIPVALSSAVAFLFLGVGLLAAAGPEVIPLRLVAGSSTRARLLRVFLPLTVGVIMVQGLLHAYLPAVFANQALGAAILSLGFALIAGGLVAMAGRAFSQALDRAEAERLRAEEAVRQGEHFLASIFASIQDGISILDTEYNIVRVNPALEQAFPQIMPLVGKKCYEAYHGSHKPCETCPSRITMATAQASRKEFIAERNAAGEALRYMELYTYPLIDQSSGQLQGVVEYTRDVTADRQAEDEKQRFAKLESLGILAGGIAHDFNNILTAILGNIGLALLDEQIGGQGRQRLTAAEKACLQAQNLAGQLLTFAKGGAPVKELVSLENLVVEVASLACRGSQVRCEYDFAQDLMAIEGDPGQIHQVFQNLIINAIQAMPGNGTVRIQGENVKIGEQSDLPLQAGNYVKISIQDNGGGIPEKYLEKIFDPYFTTKQQGSGLGLATAYSIVNNHLGHISVESRLGEGTTFHVYLPASEEKFIQPPQESTELLSGKGKILVMDDEAVVREVLGAMLRTLGYEARFAEDGVEVIKLYSLTQASAEPFTAVILDLTVPGGMGGKEAMEGLLKIDPQVKVIVSSGYFDDPIMADFQKHGFVGVIAKPYKLAELGKVLNKALTQGKQAIS